MTNIDPNRFAEVAASLNGVSAKSATGLILTAPRVDSGNTFEAPSVVSPQPFSATATDGKLLLHLPPKSVIVVGLER